MYSLCRDGHFCSFCNNLFIQFASDMLLFSRLLNLEVLIMILMAPGSLSGGVYVDIYMTQELCKELSWINLLRNSHHTLGGRNHYYLILHVGN